MEMLKVSYLYNCLVRFVMKNFKENGYKKLSSKLIMKNGFNNFLYSAKHPNTSIPKLKSLALFILMLSVVSGCRDMQVNSKDKSEFNFSDTSKTTVLKLEEGPNNPRNGEGDFITLKDGKILFVYGHFTGDTGADYGHAHLACRFQ